MAESCKVSRFSKEEFEEYQKVYHQEYGHNAMVPGIFKEFASEIYAKIDERVSENTREMAKNSRIRAFLLMSSRDRPRLLRADILKL